MIKDLLLSVAASLGAAAVAWGLWLESLGEKEWYKDIGEFRSSKLKAHRGLKWVFWGVIAEMVLGFALAVWDGWEIRQVTSDIAKNDPFKQPITSITADVTIRYNTNAIASAQPGWDIWPRVDLMASNFTARLVPDMATTFGSHNGPDGDFLICSTHFVWQPGGKSFSPGIENLIGEDAFKMSISATANLPFLQYKTHILGGAIDVFFNGSAQKKEFIIPAQWKSSMPIITKGCLPFRHIQGSVDTYISMSNLDTFIGTP